MSLIIPANTLASGGFAVDNSCRFNSGSSDNLTKTFSLAETSDKIATVSFWIKRSKLSAEMGILKGDNSGTDFIRLESNDKLRIRFSGGSADIITNRLFRDVSAWYHIVIAFDTTQGTSSNRIKLYVNGVQETSLATSTYPSLNTPFKFSTNSGTNTISTADDVSYYGGYISEFVWIDGTQNAVTDFGEFDEDSGIWKPIDVSGLTFGTNGFYLEFKDSSALGDDTSGNGNDFTVNNLTSIDQTTDTPTNNFATTNPLDQNGGMTFSDGNLSTASTSASWRSTRGTFGVTQGKWYWEVKAVNTGGSLLDMMVGVASFDIAIPSEFSSSNPALTYTAGSGNKQLNGVNTAYGATYNVGDIIGVAFDVDALTVTFYKNGTSQGSISTGWSSGIFWSPAISLYGRYGNTQASFNFGNPPFTISSGNSDGNGYGNFEYAVPSGYLSLCTKNLSEVLG